MQRRSDARRTFAEEAIANLSVEEKEVINAAAEAEDQVHIEHLHVNASEESIDESVTRNENSIQTPDTTNVEACQSEAEEVDEEERKRDKDVEKVVISPVTRPIEDENDVRQEVHQRFSALGVKVIELRTYADRNGKYKTGVAVISPVNLNRIWGRRLGLKNCSVIEYFDPPSK